MVNIRNRWCKLSPSLPMYLQGNSWTKLYRNSRTKTIIVIYPIIPHIDASAYIGLNIAWHLCPAWFLKFELSCMCVCVCVCVCVSVCVCVCVCLRPFTVKTSSVWISWNVREQINNVVLKMFLSSAKSLHHYFKMKHQTFLTSHFILFTH